jgi:putative acetyltransferase
MTRIQAARNEDHPRLLTLWLDSVRATHHFLSEEDIQSLLPVVRDLALPQLKVWVLRDDALGIVGFMGLAGAGIEALFISPSFFRRGGGKLLIEHARRLKGPLSVSVNEQNPSALAFYEANGFTVTSRSAVDGQGRPFPLLHLSERP